RHALVAKDGCELRVVEALAEEAVLPAFAPEAVAAFDPESLTAGREIGDRELGLRPGGAGPRRNAGRPRHRGDKGLHDAVRVAKIAVDVFPFDGKAATLEQAVDAEGVDTLRDRIHELGCVLAVIAGDGDFARQCRAVREPPGAGAHTALAVHRSPH